MFPFDVPSLKASARLLFSVSDSNSQLGSPSQKRRLTRILFDPSVSSRSLCISLGPSGTPNTRVTYHHAGRRTRWRKIQLEVDLASTQAEKAP
jgi:hypothetical protein